MSKPKDLMGDYAMNSNQLLERIATRLGWLIAWQFIWLVIVFII